MKIRNFVIFGLLALAFVMSPVATNAQTVQDLQAQIQALMEQLRLLQQGQTTPPVPIKWCYTFTLNLSLGSSGAEVTALQTALTKLVFYNIVISGYFGVLTKSALTAWQTSSGEQPATGYFGPISRAKMNNIFSCKLPLPITPSITVISPNGGEGWLKGQGQTIKWTSNLPTDYPVRIVLRYYIDSNPFGNNYYDFIIGSPNGSDSKNDGYEKISIASGLTTECPSGSYYNPATGVFCFPSGVYKLQVKTVMDVNDWSDSYFKIYDSNVPPKPTNLPPSISGVSGPTVLNVGQSGTWSVQASDPENGSLSYSVMWGDEILSALTTAGSPTSPVQQTATFTHTYSRTGTFTPTFTVTDNVGQSARTSLSVAVGGGTNTGYLYKFTFPGSAETMYTGQYYTIKWMPITDDPVRNIARYALVFYDNSGNPLQSTVINVNDGYFQNWQVPQTIPSGKYSLAISRTSDLGKELVAVSDNFQVIASTNPPQPIPAPTITSSNPPNGAIDARDTSGELKFGFYSTQIPNGYTFPISDFSVSSTRTDLPISVTGVQVSGSVLAPAVIPILNRSMQAGERMTIKYKPSNFSVCLGFLPGDVDQNGWALARDISLLNSWLPTAASLGGGVNQPDYKKDINRDGVFNVQDVTRAGELMSSADRVVKLPACPAPAGGVGMTISQSQMANTLSALSSALQNLQRSLRR